MNTKRVEEYLQQPYTIEVMRDPNPENPGWVARVVELPGAITQADTFEELEAMVQDAMRGWIEVALEDGEEIPEPRREEDYSGKFIVRVPKSLHRRLALAAEREGTSLNQFVSTVLASAVSPTAPAAPQVSPQEIRAWIQEAVQQVVRETGLVPQPSLRSKAQSEKTGPLWEGVKVLVLEQVESDYVEQIAKAGALNPAEELKSDMLDELSD